MQIETERLLLRPWSLSDLEPFAKLNADPKVMEFFPATRNFQESKEEFERICKTIEMQGWGLWAASLKADNRFIGFVGLNQITEIYPFAPAIEIGWRLDQPFWGFGFATEGARAACSFAFNQLNLPEIVSFTAKLNLRSQNVMEKIGMHRNSEEDFDHPKLPDGHPLKRHVLYRLTGKDWQKFAKDDRD